MKREGLTSKEAKKLLEKFGPNEIREVSKNSPWKILLRQIRSNFVVYLLFFAMIASFFVGKGVTGYTIFAVLAMIVIVGFYQEYRAEKALSVLKNMIMPVSVVIREGEQVREESKNLVPGDLLVLRAGEKIPADCIIIEQKDLLVNESILTGESREIAKCAARSIKRAKDENKLFMGSFVVSGRCVCEVLHTGMNSKFGKIAGMISTAEKELPLSKKINNIAKFMAVVALIVSSLTGLLMFLRVEQVSPDYLIEIIILMIAIAVSAFPQGFPVVLIATLSSGVYKMAQQNAIVNRMSIVETLGETTVICSDKTGTLTTGEMTVKKIYSNYRLIEVEGAGYEASGDFKVDSRKINPLKDKVLDLLMKACVLCNDARIERTGEDNFYKSIGTPTESALLVMAAKANVFYSDLNFERKKEIPFSSDKKMMSVSGILNSKEIVFVKGAPEVVLKHCDFVRTSSGTFRLTKKERERIMDKTHLMARETLRTLAIAYKPKKQGEESLDAKLIFLGLIGMHDPPHEEVKNAINLCKQAGISVKMITGDNKETAVAIAKQIKLSGKVLEGFELDELSDEELKKRIGEITIFARVKPAHKLRIVKALKENGEIVTMTGDGVNDAPALKEAHIGIAMGRNGTDVSREVADLTLKDDNFVTIVSAIKEGRTIFKNIRKFVTYQLSCNFAELAIIFGGVLLTPLLGWQVPVLLALQILFMNLVTDNLPAITLGFNPSSPNIMDESPRRKAQILTKDLIKLLALTGIFLAVFTLGAVYLSFNIYGNSFEYARTVGFVSLVMIEIASAFNFRSFRKGVFGRSIFINKYLAYASLISILATIGIIYLPGINTVFGMVPISSTGWIVSLLPATLIIVLFDYFKKLNNKRKFLELEG